MSSDIAGVIRKLRKKLRQIENLERLQRELTEEEEDKVDSKDDLRDELKRLLKAQESEMENITKYAQKAVLCQNEKRSERLDGDETCTERLDGDDIEQDKEETDGKTFVEDANEVDMPEPIELLKTNESEQPMTKEPSKQIDDPAKLTITRESLRERKSKPKHKEVIAKPVATSRVACPLEQFFHNLTLKVTQLEGHHDDILAADLYDQFIVSGGRDTSLKLWVVGSSEEFKSFGGHESAITGVRFMTDTLFCTYPNVVTSSYDCSIRIWDLEQGSSLKSIYVYSPIVCLDYSDGMAAVGTEGGKIEIYNVETGEKTFTVNAFDDAISAIKIGPGRKLAAGSSDGLLKIYDTNTSTTPVFTSLNMTVRSPTSEDALVVKPTVLKQTKITCIVFQNAHMVCYGDEGYNLKVVDIEKGEVTKVCNNLKEYCPTEALYICEILGKECLFSVGADVDTSDGYLNVRSLPDLKYLGTIRDLDVNSGMITSLCVQEVGSRIRIVTAGKQLRIWDQVVQRERKRKSSREDDSLIPCKYICNYNERKDSEPESESEPETSSQTSSKALSTKSEVQSQSYCTIL